MTSFAVYVIILGFYTLNWAFIFLGALVLLAQYFYNTIAEEQDRRAGELQLNETLRERNREFNEGLRKAGRLN